MASLSVIGLLLAPPSPVHFTALHGDDEFEGTNYPDKDDEQKQGMDTELQQDEII